MPDFLEKVYFDIGGGLPALVILGLCYWVWSLHKSKDALQDRMLEREREHSAEIVETIVTVRDAVRVVESKK
ncbi:hypothetical protein ACSQ76_12225 [Roseovarius sp. B08]|uniref:hypothetical protein n=1 Tax=Roseovarius sp. B08 TaxID=3449223 RepID=UPI003EDC9D6E